MFYAIGNIGDSKKTDKTRLTDPTDKYECILEVMDNTLPNSTMPTGKTNEKTGAPIYPIDKSEWTTGNTAYDALYGDTFDEASSKDKPNGLADTYGWRYIYKNGTSEENAAARAYVENKWREFYEFVVTSTDEEFKAHLGDYCVLDSVMYYYLFTLRYTMTDNHAKNSFWHYGKSNDLDEDGNPIRKWDLCMDYDNDTALGIDNYGRMSYRYGYEEIDYVDGTKDWVWNAPQHVFFLRLRELFDAELCALYTRLESGGAWSATGLINQFNEWQSQFPEELWRLDIQRKYIRTYTTSFIGGEAKEEFLRERANGRKKTQRAQFEKNQEKYMSSKFGSNVAAADDIILRCSVPNTSLAVPANFDMHLTPYSYMYINVKYNTSAPIKVRAIPNVEYTIKYDAELADIIEIYSASCYKSIGDLSSHYLINGDFANASKIRELILGNSTPGYNNTNSMTLGLGANRLLNKLDIQNMSGLSHSLDLSGLKNLEEIYAFGSNVSGVIFADRGNVSVAQLPSIGSLSMKNLPYLDDDGFEVSSYDKLSRLVVENSLLDLVSIINNSPNLYQARLIGVNWTLDSTALLERLYDLAGITNTGGNLDRAIVSGRVSVPVIKQQQLYNYNNAWPDLVISAGTTIEQHAVTFINDDGTILEVQYVDNGGYAVDPVTRDVNPIPEPTKESTVSTDYTYAGWNLDLKVVAIREPKTVKAMYTESTRTYTVRYVSRGEEKQVTVAPYGSNVIYENDIPTYTLEEGIGSEKFYLFNRWDKSGFVDGDKTINAVFDEFKYTNNAFADKELRDMRPVELYALTRLVDMGVLSVVIRTDDEGTRYQTISETNIQTGDDYSFIMGYDINYEDVEMREIISEKTVFDGAREPIDTDIKLFDVDKDFVLALDYRMSSDNTSGATLMQCFQTAGANGFKLYYGTNTTLSWAGSMIQPSSSGNREMLVIRHKKGDNNLYVYTSNIGSDNIETFTINRDFQTQSDIATLVFGASKQDSGRFTNHCNGTIYWCKIWYMDLGEKACEQLVSWTHEKITLEVDGFYRYALYDDYTKESTISLLATHLLDKKMNYNDSQTSVGGWAESKLNSFLNTRFYNAIPHQIKSLLKKVSVSSTIGNKSTEISSSGCYVNIPALYDVDDTFGGISNETFKQAYRNEVYDSNGTINYMTGTESRKRAFVEGNYYAYYTRSPNPSYTNYINGVDESGSTYFVSLNPKTDSGQGVLIEVSI